MISYMSKSIKSNTSAKPATLADAVSKLKDHTSELNTLINKKNQTGSKDVIEEISINLAVWDIIQDLQDVLSMKIDSRKNARAGMFVVWESSKEDEECVTAQSDSTIFDQIYELFNSFQTHLEDASNNSLKLTSWKMLKDWLDTIFIWNTRQTPGKINKPRIDFWKMLLDLQENVLDEIQSKELWIFTQAMYRLAPKDPTVKRLVTKEQRCQKLEKYANNTLIHNS